MLGRMMMPRRLIVLGLFALGCSGGMSTLKTVRPATGSGPIEFEVQNNAGVALNNLYMAKTETVRAADRSHLERDSTEEVKVWGEDLLDRGALEEGGRVSVPVPEPGRWDVRVLDRNDRYQLIAGLKLGAGGRYILEIEDGGWRMIR
jgi:hypothetical protein